MHFLLEMQLFLLANDHSLLDLNECENLYLALIVVNQVEELIESMSNKYKVSVKEIFTNSI